ncbi:MAG: biotin--[Clostridia bacterium]|nr:biotin--[acetyl-CoA-carboxylase] ligase [Clostridia bacterium]
MPENETKNPLSKQEIAENLSESLSPFVGIEYYDSCDSTNRLAKEAEILYPLEVYVANSQTKGRGRLGRSFYSAEGAGLYMSFLYKPTATASDALAITRYAAVKVARAIEAAAGVSCQIKWVNDIYISGKKVCGILTEGVLDTERGVLDRVVLGIGINVRRTDFPDDISAIATSIEDEAGVKLNRSQLAARIIELIYEGLSELSSVDIVREYRERSNLIGRRVTVIRADSSYAAEVLDISDGGALVLRTAGGEIEELISGEVSVRLI